MMFYDNYYEVFMLNFFGYEFVLDDSLVCYQLLKYWID